MYVMNGTNLLYQFRLDLWDECQADEVSVFIVRPCVHGQPVN